MYLVNKNTQIITVQQQCSRCGDMWILASGALHFSWSTLKCVTADDAYQSEKPRGQKNCSAAQRHHRTEAETWGRKITSAALKVPESTEASIILKCNKLGTSRLFPELAVPPSWATKRSWEETKNSVVTEMDGFLYPACDQPFYSEADFCSMSL